MKETVRKYLERHSEIPRWTLNAPPLEGVEIVVVIPLLAEHPGFITTLEDLSQNDPHTIEKTLVIGVINNRPLPPASSDDLENNRKTIEFFKDQTEKPSSFRGLRVGYVEASSAGNEIPESEGVGLARKIGLDWGLRILAGNDRETCPLVNLDADTRVDENYLESIGNFFDSEKRWAAVVDYAHPTDGEKGFGDERQAIIGYETFLRYHELGLLWAGSPYAFPTIGSTIACSAEAYATVRGMSRRQAGEDFYFLQKLAKTGRVDQILETTVRPSPRASSRVPFGTGASVRKYLKGESDWPAYSPDVYGVLRRWIGAIPTVLDKTASIVLQKAGRIEPELESFLIAQGFPEAWENMRTHSNSVSQMARQFHGWFDGFRTLKFIHHLRDTRHPSGNLAKNAARLLEMMDGSKPDARRAKVVEGGELLSQLRDRRREMARETGPLGLVEERMETDH